jgi:hypothetical protein
MRTQNPRLLTALLMALAGSNHAVLADGPVCAIEAPPLNIKVSAEPDDGSWGPTLEIVVEDAVQPLTRLIAQETRPVEACWWQVMKGLGVPALVIGVGATESEGAAALVFVWREGRLDRHPVPTLEGPDTDTYHYIVRDGFLEAHPPPNARGLASSKPVYRLSGRVWVPVPALQ